ATTASPRGAAPALDRPAFARLHARLSGPGGYFDTDNLISNEASYLHVLGALEELGVRGGAYLGVGPGQNFAYIAAIRPRIAFIVDIRRDNALEHLMFKALFESAPTRVEYLGLLLGRAPPTDPGAWHDAPVDEILQEMDVAADPAAAQRARTVVDSAVVTFGISLSAEDRATIRRFHDEFIAGGLALRFRSFGRAPRPYYPTLRQLLQETDLSGRPRSCLARREDYLFLRDMQRRNLVVPVVGDLAGEHALPAVAEELRARGEVVSALYVSNVEFYLFGQGTFSRFADNVGTLPVGPGSVLIRSVFPGRSGVHPHAVPGYYSTQSLQTLRSFTDAAHDDPYRSYRDLVTRDALDPREPGALVRE
ncbi:MAG TPA: hypothetical protein VE173_07025, partial [Longimicrobiales bacterium]|nr:hypothetical protein [Longimicrobiales bacterium]